MFQCDSKGAALPGLTLYLYGSAKQIHIFPDDRHAQSGSCDLALCGILLTCEGFENLCLIILTHTDPGIAHPGPHAHVSRLIAG